MEIEAIQSSGNKLTLRVDSGLSLGKVFCLRDGRSTMGRSVDVEIPIDDSRASRIHASIHEMEGDFFISDLGSTNGTFLNEVFLKEAKKLKTGDRIRVGSTVFVVQSLETSKNEAAPAWRETTRAIRPQEIAKNAQEKKREVEEVSVLGLPAQFFKNFSFIKRNLIGSFVSLRKILAPVQKFLDQSFGEFLSNVFIRGTRSFKSVSNAAVNLGNKSDQKKARLLVAAVSILIVFAAIFASL